MKTVETLGTSGLTTGALPANAAAGESAPSSKPSIIAIQNLRVEYPVCDLGSKTKIAVHDLTLSVYAGEVFGFLGPNGAGKTSTMNVLLGFVHATRGSASIFGVNVEEAIA